MLLFSRRSGQKLVDETVTKINELVEAGELAEGQYGFLTYLLGKPDLTYNDVSIITLSLFGDGLSTVSVNILLNDTYIYVIVIDFVTHIKSDNVVTQLHLDLLRELFHLI